MTTTLKAMLLAAPLALIATSADATVYRFDLSGIYAATFHIESVKLAPPADSGSDYFLVNGIAGTFGGMAQVASSIQFSTLAADGGMTIELPNGDFRGFFGSQLFTGTTAMPSFTPGRYTLTSDINGATGMLRIAAVPEPATWAMMIAGFGAVGLSVRRRKAVVAVA